MTTALERITQLSGLSGVSAAQHLKQIAGAAGIAGALLVAFSGLPTGTAAEHLLANGGTPPPVTDISYGGGFGSHGEAGHDLGDRGVGVSPEEADVVPTLGEAGRGEMVEPVGDLADGRHVGRLLFPR